MIRARDDLAELLERRLSVSVVLARREISLESLLSYSEGSVIVLEDVTHGELEIEGTPVGHGTVIRIGSQLALRVDRIRPRSAFAAELEIPSEGEVPRR